jgi:hypothetical protein
MFTNAKIYFSNVINISVFNYWAKESIKKELGMLSPWVVNPFTPQGKKK